MDKCKKMYVRKGTVSSTTNCTLPVINCVLRYAQVVVLAESEGYDADFEKQVYTELPTTNNEWAINVAYCVEGCIEWYIWSLLMWAIISLAVSILVYTVFAQKQFHADAMTAKSALMVESAERSARSERELNDFIAHEVSHSICAIHFWAFTKTDYPSSPPGAKSHRGSAISL